MQYLERVQQTRQLRNVLFQQASLPFQAQNLRLSALAATRQAL